MSKFDKHFLNVGRLEKLGGRFEGVVSDVTEKILRNPYNAKKENQAIVSFTDGHQLILNVTLLRQFIAWFGEESTNWIGRIVVIFLKGTGKIDRATGAEKMIRGALCNDVHARQPVAAKPNRDDESTDAADVTPFQRRAR